MRPPALACLLVLASCLDAAAENRPSAPGTGSVAVYRGGSSNTVSPVTVHRGSAAAPGYLATSPLASLDTETVGGRQLWLVDRAGDRLTNCRAWNTTIIGQRRIVCVRSPLPD
ncbi:MAG: hypothetical protein U1E52_13545 [Geminicoccaceae bacterium]